MRDGRLYGQVMRERELADRIEQRSLRLLEGAFLRTLAMDASHLPGVTSAKVRSWPGERQTAAITASGWESWNVPNNASFVAITCLGGASGGGGGLTGASGTARGGGGGGASGAFSRAIFSAQMIPRQLFILPGNGGSGSTGSGVAGTVGGRSAVADRPNTLGTAANTLLVSGAAANTGGVAGTAVGAQAGGTAETIATNVLGMYMAWAVSLVFIAGQAGAAAGALSVNGGAVAFGGAGLPCSGGGGGGSTNTTNVEAGGGAVTGAGIYQTVSGGTTGGGAGGMGYTLNRPRVSLGGGGGGSTGLAGTAGAGGKGGFGSGGGGGGGGVTGGAGGDGSPGLAMIAWW